MGPGVTEQCLVQLSPKGELDSGGTLFLEYCFNQFFSSLLSPRNFSLKNKKNNNNKSTFG